MHQVLQVYQVPGVHQMCTRYQVPQVYQVRCVPSKAALGRMGLYESFAQATQLGELHTCLMMDMKACQEDDVRLLCFLTPSIYTEVSPPHLPRCARVCSECPWGGPVLVCPEIHP